MMAQDHDTLTRARLVTEAGPASALWAELERIYCRLAAYSAQGEPAATTTTTSTSTRPAIPGSWNSPAKIRELFGLSEFELDILLLTAGAALDGRFSAALARAQPASPVPTLGLAAALLENPHWSALSRMRPLRYWRLIEIGPAPLLQAPLTIDERILQYLLGVPAADERLELILHDVTDAEEGDLDGLPEAWGAALREAATHGALHWQRASPAPLLLTGGRGSERTALFRALCRMAGLHPWVLDAADLPEAAADRERLARAFTREAALWPAALLVKTERLEAAPSLDAWLRRLTGPVAVDIEPGSPAERLRGQRLAAPSLRAAERKSIWRQCLGPLAAPLEGELDALVAAFALDAREIRDAAEAIAEHSLLQRHDTPDSRSNASRDGGALRVADSRSKPSRDAAALGPADSRSKPSRDADALGPADSHSNHSRDAGALGAAAWQFARTVARRSLDELATHVESGADWLDLVLPEAQTATLRQVAVHARQASVVHGEWGFGARHAGGLGLSTLFSGPSGTGKTMAAGVLARELGRDLYQIDLATVVSKYIGETEKHLRKIFDAAERSGAILLFDEADALFGKRSQVRDSHDRYANLEVSYLLQRMESYRGIAILTTNMQNALDAAFQRRLRFVVQFPFPDAASRERIWRKVFPAAAPTVNLDYPKLAQLNVTGGAIRNIALLSAFLAAHEGTAISMGHLLAAARTEYAKLDRPLSPAETRGWA